MQQLRALITRAIRMLLINTSYDVGRLRFILACFALC